jgi:hypothetical protein
MSRAAILSAPPQTWPDTALMAGGWGHPMHRTPWDRPGGLPDKKAALHLRSQVVGST